MWVSVCTHVTYIPTCLHAHSHSHNTMDVASKFWKILKSSAVFWFILIIFWGTCELGSALVEERPLVKHTCEKTSFLKQGCKIHCYFEAYSWNTLLFRRMIVKSTAVLNALESLISCISTSIQTIHDTSVTYECARMHGTIYVYTPLIRVHIHTCL